MPSAPAAGKCGIGAGRTSVSQSWKVTGHFFRLHLRQENTGHDFSLQEFPFSDDDESDRLERVRIVTVPAARKGALTLDGAPVRAGDTVTPSQLEAGLLSYSPPPWRHGRQFASFAFRVGDGKDESAADYTQTISVTRSSDGYHVAGGGKLSQSFTTGPHPAGYRLEDVTVGIIQGTPAVPAFSIYTPVSRLQSKPGTDKVLDLTGSVATTGDQTFTPAPDTPDRARILAPDTSYHVVFAAASQSPASVRLQQSTDPPDVSRVPEGWSLENWHYYYDRVPPNNSVPWAWGISTSGIVPIGITATPVGGSPQIAVDPPIVEGVPRLSGAADGGTWREGETVEVTLTFSEAVDVDTTDGTPSVGLALGATPPRPADYLRGSGTTEVVFGYTLVEGDGDHTAVLVMANSLTLDGGTIRSQATQADARLDHDGAGTQGGGGPRNDAPQASFQDVPERHDGETAFTLGLRFSGEPSGLDPKRDAASVLEVTGGTVTGARRTETGARPVWEVTVAPSGIGDVTVRLPARACGEARHRLSAP